MQIQSYNNINFKGLQCHPSYADVQYIIATKMGGYGFDKTMKVIDELAKRKTPTEIYVAGDVLDKPKIYAEVAGKTFKENFFYGPHSIVKKVLKYVNKLEKQEQEVK